MSFQLQDFDQIRQSALLPNVPLHINPLGTDPLHHVRLHTTLLHATQVHAAPPHTVSLPLTGHPVTTVLKIQMQTVMVRLNGI